MSVCAFAQPLGKALSVIDRPDGRRKIHSRPTPLVGGLAILVPVVAAAVLQAMRTPFGPLYGMLAAAVAVFVLVGLLDDRGHIRATVRLAVSTLLVALVLWAVPGLSVRFLTFSFDGQLGPLFLGNLGGAAFTLLCLVGLQNAVNMADGKNGLVIGMSIVWSLVLLAHAPAHMQPVLIVLLTGLSLTLLFNVSGKLFLGDAGTYGLSICLGLLTLYVYNVSFATFPADAVALMFLVPVVDTLRLMVARALEGRSPFASGRDHLHHILLSVLPWHWALTVYLALVAVPSVLASFATDWIGLWALVALIVYGAIVSIKYRPAAARASGVGPASS